MHEVRWQSLHPQWFSDAALGGISPGTSRPALPQYKCSCWNPKATSNRAAACSQPTPTAQSGHWVVQMESIWPAAVILQSLQLHIAIPADCNPCNYSFSLSLFFFFFFPHLRLGPAVRAVHTGQAHWLLSWWRLIKRGEKRQMPLLSSPHREPSQIQGCGWVGAKLAKECWYKERLRAGRSPKTNCSPKKGAQVSAQHTLSTPHPPHLYKLQSPPSLWPNLK